MLPSFVSILHSLAHNSRCHTSSTTPTRDNTRQPTYTTHQLLKLRSNRLLRQLPLLVGRRPSPQHRECALERYDKEEVSTQTVIALMNKSNYNQHSEWQKINLSLSGIPPDTCSFRTPNPTDSPETPKSQGLSAELCRCIWRSELVTKKCVLKSQSICKKRRTCLEREFQRQTYPLSRSTGRFFSSFKNNNDQ